MGRKGSAWCGERFRVEGGEERGEESGERGIPGVEEEGREETGEESEERDIPGVEGLVHSICSIDPSALGLR